MFGIRSNFGGAAAVMVGLVIVASVVVVLSRRQSSGNIASLARVLTWLCAVGVLAATVMPQRWPFRRDGFGDLMLVPGSDALGRWDVLFTDPGSLAAVLLMGNVALFVPLGLCGLIGWGRARTVLLNALLFSVLIEAMQMLLLSRIAATDDVLCNVTGAGLGVGIGLLLRRHFGSPVGAIPADAGVLREASPKTGRARHLLPRASGGGSRRGGC